ncbi:MAG: phage holin family protein [Propionibacteriales bacterium]|nr:phage holin family protein [Propionibacteriales bacterium]
MTLLITLVVNALALAAAAWLFQGITLTGAETSDRALTLVIVAAIFGVVNAIVRPVVKVLSLPLYVLTLGLVAFVINALMLMLTSWICDLLDVGFTVEGFWTALGGALVVSVVGMLLGSVLPDKD